tara:strand:- start:743 stop:979 length:237 start_codon:yes stop_codon:yes gene_type:complete
MFYSQDTALWGFIAHIPVAIILLAFISRQVELREQGDSLGKRIFDDNSRKILRRVAVGGIFGLVFIGTMSPLSRFMLQ